jgi:hypothetical protein
LGGESFYVVAQFCLNKYYQVRFLIRGWTKALLIQNRWDSTKNDVMNDFEIKSHEVSENLSTTSRGFAMASLMRLKSFKKSSYCTSDSNWHDLAFQTKVMAPYQCV